MGGAQHYAVKLKKELFPMVIKVNIHFPIDRRELFKTVSAAAWIFSKEKGKKDIHYNVRREKFLFQFHSIVLSSTHWLSCW